MAQQMVYDVCRFALMLSGIFYAFAVALVVLFRGEVGGTHPVLEDGCKFLDDREGHSPIKATLMVLVEILLDARDPAEVHGHAPQAARDQNLL
jgi:hypothetical protein